jgi:enamine deaminase RidA (YjgF/YER057c/UK114 family)
MTPQQRLESLNLALPPAPKSAGLYKPALVVDRLVYLSGHLPVQADGALMRGCVGRDLDADAGKHAARLVALAMLATLVAALGSLDRVQRLVKLLGAVNCTPEFEKHPHVINGASEIFAEIWGPDHGVGARSAVGMSSLPMGVAVEIEAVFELA